MQIVWHILLTVCLGSNCIEQDVQWFDEEEECHEMLRVYSNIPTDGKWDSIEYICKPVGSRAT